MPDKRPDWKDELNRVAAHLKSGGATEPQAPEHAHGPSCALATNIVSAEISVGTSASLASGSDRGAINEAALAAERHVVEVEGPFTRDLGALNPRDIDTASNRVPSSVVEIKRLQEELRAKQDQLDSM